MMVIARRDGPPGRPFVKALIAKDNPPDSVDVASLSDQAPFGWHFPPRRDIAPRGGLGVGRQLATVRGSAFGDRAAEQ